MSLFSTCAGLAGDDEVGLPINSTEEAASDCRRHGDDTVIVAVNAARGRVGLAVYIASAKNASQRNEILVAPCDAPRSLFARAKRQDAIAGAFSRASGETGPCIQKCWNSLNPVDLALYCVRRAGLADPALVLLSPALADYASTLQSLKADVRPFSHFSVAVGVSLIATGESSNTANLQARWGRDDRLYSAARLASRVDPNWAPLSIGCAGAILTLLDSSSSSEGGNSDNVVSYASAFCSMARENSAGRLFSCDVVVGVLHIPWLMSVSLDALISLQVFGGTDKSAKLGSSGKNVESARSAQSLYQLFSKFTCTRDARALLSTWLAYPLYDYEMIRERQETVKFLANPVHTQTILAIQSSLKKIKSMPLLLSKPQLTYFDWHGLATFVRKVPQVLDHIDLLVLFAKNQRNARLPGVLENLVQAADRRQLRRIELCIFEIIDFQASLVAKTCVVKPGVSPELDEKRQIDQGLSTGLLRLVATRVCEECELDKDLQTSLNVMYLPQLGYLIAFPRMLFESSQRLFQSALEYQFSSPDFAFFKNTHMRELDITLGDIHSAIVDLEIEIIQELWEKIKTEREDLIEIHKHLCDLDCYLSFSEAAKAYKYVCPTLKVVQKECSSEIQMTAARHPLYEQSVETFISNDVNVSCEKLEVVTGPNSSGKSVYLKTIGLSVIMAQIGSYVAASSAEVTLVDRLFARIATLEVPGTTSAFLADLQLVSRAVGQATKHSLVLLDEFGKGTPTPDGAGLVAAVIRHFTQDQNRCRVLLTTHFHELLVQRDILGPCASEVVRFLRTEVVQRDDMQLVYLYKVIQGQCTESLGAYCALSAGVPEHLVERAVMLSQRLSQGRGFEESDFSDDDHHDNDQSDMEAEPEKILNQKLYEHLVSSANVEANSNGDEITEAKVQELYQKTLSG